MISSFAQYSPNIAETVWIAHDADIIGNVTIKTGCSIFFHSVIRGDNAPIVIAEYTNIQDGCILHSDPDHTLFIGKGVSVGHGAILHGCNIGDHCLIGMRSVILNGAVIEPDCIIAAGSVVLEHMHIPQGSLVVGCPAKVIKSLTEAQRNEIRQNAEHYQELAQIYRKGE